MIGIYCIEHITSGKKYIGKSIGMKYRFYTHKWQLTKSTRSKDCNRHLYNAVQKYGIENFKMYALELFDIVDETILKERELYWMDFYNTCNASFGYNLRRDSSTKMITSKETLKLQSILHTGPSNANYGNRWTVEQKERMRKIAKERHASGKYYTEKTRKLNAQLTKQRWSNLDKRKQMAKAVSKAKLKYDFYQYNAWGTLIRVWTTIAEIINENPGYKWQNIYSVCNGYKKTYMGYIWKKMLKKKNLN